MAWRWLIDTIISQFVEIVFGIVLAQLHNLAGNHPHTWFGEFLRARDAAPPQLPQQQNGMLLNLSPQAWEMMRTTMIEAVREGNEPLVTAIEALTASTDADIAQRRSRTLTAVHIVS